MTNKDGMIRPSKLAGEHVGKVIDVIQKANGEVVAAGVFKGFVIIDYKTRLILEGCPVMIVASNKHNWIKVIEP